MTELTDEAVKALLDGATPRFLIRKHGGYYRPNCQGYTSSAILAGRYTEAKAISETHPNGPNGPRDGMTYTSEDAITDEDFAAYIALREQRDDLARALLASRAELARVKADAAAAQARGMERAAKMLESRAELLVQDEGSWEPDTNVTNLPEWAESECEVLEESARLIRDLAPVDGLALVAELRAERDADKAHVLRLLPLASERDRLAADPAVVALVEAAVAAELAALQDPLVVHLNMVAGKIAKPLPSQLVHIYGEEAIRAAAAAIRGDEAMTDLITAEEAQKLLVVAVPGPWRADGEPWNRIVWSFPDNRVCFMSHSNGLDDARDIATSELVASAPDLARTVIALHAELAQARAAAILETKP